MLGLTALLFAHVVLGQLRFLSPPDLKKAFDEGGAQEVPHGIIPASTASFGTPLYGDSYIGRLLIVDDTGCEATYADKVLEAYNVSLPLDQPQGAAGNFKTILMLHRGACSFTKKALVAQAYGADGLVIGDVDSSDWNRSTIRQVILSDDGQGAQVRIPTLLISAEDAKYIYSELEQLSGTPPIISLEWVLPHTSLVTVDFWYSPGNVQSMSLFPALRQYAIKLEGLINFRPHLYILRLDTGGTGDAAGLCWHDDQSLCIQPPDAATALDPQEVLFEAVRELCLYSTTFRPVTVRDAANADSNVTISDSWWEYMDKLPTACPLKKSLRTASNQFGHECSTRLMSQISGVNVTKVDECFTSPVADQVLANERDNNAWGPLAVVINGARYSGSRDAELIVRAACTAFDVEPPLCQEVLEKQAASGTDAVAVVPSQVVSGQTSFGQSFVLFVALVSVLAVAFYAYTALTNHSLRQALRNEVSLEVKTQLQDYYRVDDPQAHWNQTLMSRETEMAASGGIKYR